MSSEPNPTGPTGLFAQFPVVGVDRILHRTIYSSAGVVVVAGVAAILLGHPLVAPGLLLGLILALVNHRVFQSSAMRFTSEEGTVRRKPFAGSVFLRLGTCTVIAVALLVFARPIGWGVVGALAIFQALMLLNAIVALIGYQRADNGRANA
jgi:uncharacterized membrane protein